MNRLEGKVAMITGGALGIGRADCLLFAREGARVAVTDINEAEGKRVVEEIRGSGGEAIFIRLDVTREEDWIAAFQAITDKYGKINIMVQNAGISLGKNIEDTTLAEWELMMKVNATGVFLGDKYAIKAMKDNGEPCSIVNRSSIDGQVAEAGLATYCASKGSVTVLTKAAALHCGEKGYKIRVNSVHPAYVHTGLTEKEAADSGLTNEQYFAKVGKLHPIGYIGRPVTSLTPTFTWLRTNPFLWSGSELTIDGGWTAQ